MRTKLLIISAISTCALLTSCNNEKPSDILGLQKIDGKCYVAQNDSNKWIYVNAQGKKLFDKEFSQGAGYFFDGLAKVTIPSVKGQYIFITETGEQAFEGQYVSATDFIDGIALVAEKDSTLKAIDRTGKKLFGLPDVLSANAYTDGLALVVTTKGKAGFINKQGKYVIEPVYKVAGTFINGVSIVTDTTGMTGAINTKGEYVVTPGNYQQLSPLYNNEMIMAVVDGKVGLLDRKGQYVVQPTYKGMVGTTGGYIIYCDDNDKVGLLDPNGNVAFETKYKAILYQESQMVYAPESTLNVVVADNNKCGVIDAQGNDVVPAQYERIKLFKKDILVRQDGKWGMLDDKGQMLIEPQFQELDFFYNGTTAFAMTGDGLKVIDRKGNVVSNTDLRSFKPKRPTFNATSNKYDPEVCATLMETKIDDLINECLTTPALQNFVDNYNLNISWLDQMVRLKNYKNQIQAGKITDYIKYNTYITLPTKDAGQTLAIDCPVTTASIDFTVNGTTNNPKSANNLITLLCGYYPLSHLDINLWQCDMVGKDQNGTDIKYSLEVTRDVKNITVTYKYLDTFDPN